MIRVPARPSRPKAISMPSPQRGLDATQPAGQRPRRFWPARGQIVESEQVAIAGCDEQASRGMVLTGATLGSTSPLRIFEGTLGRTLLAGHRQQPIAVLLMMRASEPPTK
jgi:hypothetical protein